MNWNAIETEYVTSDQSLADLAKKYGVSKRMMGDHCKAQRWVEKRREYRDEVSTKVLQKTQEKILSDVEKGTALLNEAWLNMCDYCARKSREQLEPIDMQRISNMYSTLMPENVGETEHVVEVKFLSEEMEEYGD